MMNCLYRTVYFFSPAKVPVALVGEDFVSLGYANGEALGLAVVGATIARARSLNH